MASTWSAGPAWRTAERINGCRNCTAPSRTSIKPASTAGARASLDTGDPCISATDCPISSSRRATVECGCEQCQATFVGEVAKARGECLLESRVEGGRERDETIRRRPREGSGARQLDQRERIAGSFGENPGARHRVQIRRGAVEERICVGGAQATPTR